MGPQNELGEYAMLLCMAAVSSTYPISRASDYPQPDLFVPGSYSRFHYYHPVPFDPETNTYDSGNMQRNDKCLKAGFDSHFVSVSQTKRMQAVDGEDFDFDEIVLKQKEQARPKNTVYSG